MFKKLFEKLVKESDLYKKLKNDAKFLLEQNKKIEIEKDRINSKYNLLIQTYNEVKEESKEHEEYIDLLKFDIESQQKKRKKILNQILKLIKTLEANKTTKEIKKLVTEVKKIV